jgi:hypothetical protein
MKKKTINVTIGAFVAVVALLASPLSFAQSIEGGGIQCYCDESVTGCFHDGDSTKCSTKENCAGGKCDKKTIGEIE